MFESTIPFGEPELMRVSAFRSYLQELADASQGGVTSRLGSLGRSLMADLARFERDGGTTETIEVLAACVRHAKRATLHLQWGERVLPLTVFPQERLVHCPVGLDELLDKRLSELRVLYVEPALLRPPGEAEGGPCGEAHLHHPLGPVLWELALRGLRNELLPEIAGPAAYRIAPGLDLSGLKANATLLAALARLRQQTTNLRDIAQWPGFDRSRAVRLLNALYLQGGLIVSRSHPDAISESWFSVLGR